MDILAYIMAHSQEFLLIFTSVVTIASVISNMTPTETDNKIVAFLTSILDKLALNFKK